MLYAELEVWSLRHLSFMSLSLINCLSSRGWFCNENVPVKHMVGYKRSIHLHWPQRERADVLSCVARCLTWNICSTQRTVPSCHKLLETFHNRLTTLSFLNKRQALCLKHFKTSEACTWCLWSRMCCTLIITFVVWLCWLVFLLECSSSMILFSITLSVFLILFSSLYVSALLLADSAQ